MALSARKVRNYDLYAGHAWYVPGLGGMLALVGWYLAGALLGGVILQVLSAFLPQEAVQDYAMIVVYPVQFLPAMVYAASRSRKNMLFDPGYELDNRHSAPFSFGLIVLVTVAMTVASMFAFDLPNYWNMLLTNKSSVMAQFYDLFMEQMKAMTGGPLWASFLVVAVFAPVFEEWLCRGMVLRGLLTKMKPAWAIILSAVFFAVIHANPWQALNAFLIGLVMGYVYYKTGSLILTMLIHFINNGTAVILSNIESLQDYDYWIDILGRQNYMLVFAASCAVLAACLLVISRIRTENPWGNIDRIPAADETVGDNGETPQV